MLPWLRPWPANLRAQCFGPTQTQRHAEPFPSGPSVQTQALCVGEAATHELPQGGPRAGGWVP